LAPEREAAEQSSRPPPSAALRAVRGLVTRALAHQAASEASPDRVTNALHHACALVVHNLRESMGEDGCDALFGRAASRSETLHPVLRQLRPPKMSDISREQLSSAVAANAVATQAAIEALLANLIEILARLIGEDMALQIITRDINGDGTTEVHRGAQQAPPPGPSGAVS
jgi:hypothetical protein